MDGIILTPLKQIHTPKGDVWHGLKKSEESFFGFGEVYFSFVNKGEIKGWKQHTKMVLNLIVLSGEIEFVIYNEKEFFSVKLSPKNYRRLTIQPNLWVAFRGIEENNMLVNIASIEHNPNEANTKELSEIKYEW